MTGFEPRISGVEDDCSTNRAVTTDMSLIIFLHFGNYENKEKRGREWPIFLKKNHNDT